MLDLALPFLRYGFLGLAFIMAFLGYRLLQQAVARDNPRPAALVAIGFFLLVTIGMMIAAGFLDAQRKDVELYVPFTDPIPDAIAPPRIKVRNDPPYDLDSDGSVTIRVQDGQQVAVLIESLTSAIRTLRFQTEQLRSQARDAAILAQASGDVGIVEQ